MSRRLCVMCLRPTPRRHRLHGHSWQYCTTAYHSPQSKLFEGCAAYHRSFITPESSKISHKIFRPRDVIQPQLKTNTLKSGSHHCVHQYERASNKAEKNVWPGACPTARRSTFLSHCSGPVRLLDTLRLKSRAIFDGSNLMPIHTSCRSRDVVFTLTFGCTRAIYELKGIYNVYIVEGSDLYKYILVGQ